MPKTIPTPGSEWSPALGLAALNPKFNDGNNDGDNPRLDDDALSNAPGQIKDQWRGFRDALLVSNTSGLNLAILPGIVLGGNSLPITVAATTRTVPANQTTTLWVDTAGIVQMGADLPVQSMPLARVVAGASTILSLADLRPKSYVLPQMRAVPVFGGNSQTDVIFNTNTTYSDGRIDCRNFTIAAGVTLTIPNGYLWVEASGSVTINGSIVTAASIFGGSGFAGGARDQYYFAESGRGLGGGGGHNSAPATPYPHFASLFGSSGPSGFGMVVGNNAAGGTIVQSKGGAGGGVIVIRAAGAIVIAGNLNCNGGPGLTGSGSVLAGSLVLTGAGGGTGGTVLLQSLTSIAATAAAQLSARGGNGASGYAFNYSPESQGGGGGSGGRIICEAPAVNLTGATILLLGGSAGLSVGVPPGIAGSVGGSYGGLGGSAGAAGAAGQLTPRLITPT